MLPVDCVIGFDILQNFVVYSEGDQIRVKRKRTEEELMSCCLSEEIVEYEYEIGEMQFREDINELVKNYSPKSNKKSPVVMKIILKNESPIFQPPRRLAASEKIELSRQLEDWLNNKIIRPSNSDFASPIVIVNKRDGSKRICVDYRKLNREIIMDRYPLPLIEDLVDSLQNSKYFSIMDLENGFFHVPIDDASQKYTAFVCPLGHYEFLRAPFGLCTSPANFQRFINIIFKELIHDGSVLIYMDDIIIPSDSIENNLEKIKNVLSVASEFGLKFKWRKCKFLKTEVEYLGYKISNGTIKPSEFKTKAVTTFPEPRNVKTIQSFLGLTGYFRKFIPNYSVIARPLTELLKKDKKFVFGDKEKQSFITLKLCLTSNPVLKIYRPKATTELHTDASKLGYGAVLMQLDEDDNKFHPVHYYSRKTSKAESNYSSYELEVLAIVKSLEKLRVYLLGLKFKIITDCAAFKMTMAKKTLVPRIAGWALVLEDYDYEIQHRPGTQMRHVDALSRNPIVMVVTDELLERFQIAQNRDSQISVVRELLNHGPYQDFVLQRDIVFKKNDVGELLVWVPKVMQDEIIRKAHSEGHFGAKKMMELLQRSYYIPKMREKCENCKLNCIDCILGERKHGKAEGFLHPLSKGEYPLSIYHVDHLGPLTSTRKNYSYIFSVIDSFSKFVWIYPVKSTTAADAIQKLDVQRAIFGNPEHIIADRGSAFTSNLFGEYCKTNNIHLTLTTTGVPRGNGQVERINGVIVPALTKLARDCPENWFKQTANLQRFINCSWQRSIKCSPFEALFGVKMRNSEDTIVAEAITDEIFNAFMDERDELRAKVRSEILKSQEEQKQTFDKNRKSAKQYQEGDLVAIKRTQFGSGIKLYPKFLGPYKITRVKRNNRFDVEKIGEHEGPRVTSTAADYMKSWNDYRHEQNEVSSDESEG